MLMAVAMHEVFTCTYFESIGSVIATQAAATKHSQHSPLITRTCPSTRPWLLYHVQPTSILITQLRSEREAFLLRERVLSNAVAEEDELFHRRRSRGTQRWEIVYIMVGG